MGADGSKEKRSGLSSSSLKISEHEQHALRDTFTLVNTVDGFKRLFKTQLFSSLDDCFEQRLAETLQSMLSTKKMDQPCLQLDSPYQYFRLFETFVREKTARNRIVFYWSIFPNFSCFFTAATLLAREDTSNLSSNLSDSETEVIHSFEDWIERDRETYASQLIGLSGSEKDLCVLQLFIERRIPRLLIYLDRWMYESFTQEKHPHKPGEFKFHNPDEAKSRCFVSLLNPTVRWFLSITIPPQHLYLESEERISSRSFPLDLFGANIHKDISFSTAWDLIYDTDRDGRGVKSLSEAVHGYAASSLLLIETSDDSIFGAYIPKPWPRYEKKYFGDDRCFLVSVQPNLSVFSSLGMSENYIRFPDKERRNESVLGIGFGGQQGHERLWIDGGDDFTKGRKMEMCSTYLRGSFGPTEDEFHIKRLQIWGFGSSEALVLQQEVRDREDKFIERSKKVDPSAFFGEGQSINENPDKMMMDWMSTKRKQ